MSYATKFVHTRRALSRTIINSHQEPVSSKASNLLDPTGFFFFLFWWRSFTVPGTEVAPVPILLWFSLPAQFPLFLLLYQSCNGPTNKCPVSSTLSDARYWFLVKSEFPSWCMVRDLIFKSRQRE